MGAEDLGLQWRGGFLLALGTPTKWGRFSGHPLCEHRPRPSVPKLLLQEEASGCRDSKTLLPLIFYSGCVFPQTFTWKNDP